MPQVFVDPVVRLDHATAVLVVTVRVGEVPAAMQTLTVLADGLDRAVDVRQRTELLRLAARMCERGHIRLVGAVSDASWATQADGVTVVHLEP